MKINDLLRKTVGISIQERQSLNQDLMNKKVKLKSVKLALIRETKEKDKFKERVELLEK